jgi:hypothetical protein
MFIKKFTLILLKYEEILFVKISLETTVRYFWTTKQPLELLVDKLN